MPLAKRFLHPVLKFDNIPNRMLFLLAAAWLFYSYFLYGFAVVVREVARLFTAQMGYHEYLRLSKGQEVFYNFWFATLALIIGFGVMSKPVLLQILPRGPRHHRLSIATDQQNLPTYTLFVLTKTMIMYGFLASIIPIFLHFEFYQHKFFLLSLPFVVFINQWLSINRTFKTAGLRSMLITLTTIVVLGLFYSVIPPIALSRLDQIVLPDYPSYHFKVDLPEVASGTNETTNMRRELELVGLGIGFPVNGKGDPEIYVHDFPFDSADSKNIPGYLERVKSSFQEYERDRIAVRLYIDKEVPMKQVKLMKALVGRAGIRRFVFAAKNQQEGRSFKNDNYFKLFPRPYCDDYINFVLHGDSISNEGILPLYCYVIEESLNDAKGSVVAIKKGNVFFNGLAIDEAALYNTVRSFFQQYPNEVLRTFCDDETEFAHYIRIGNMIMKSYNDELDDNFDKLFGFTYRETLRDPENNVYIDARQVFMQKFPNRRVMELSDVEKEYLLKKSPHLKTYFPQ